MNSTSVNLTQPYSYSRIKRTDFKSFFHQIFQTFSAFSNQSNGKFLNPIKQIWNEFHSTTYMNEVSPTRSSCSIVVGRWGCFRGRGSLTVVCCHIRFVCGVISKTHETMLSYIISRSSSFFASTTSRMTSSKFGQSSQPKKRSWKRSRKKKQIMRGKETIYSDLEIRYTDLGSLIENSQCGNFKIFLLLI